MLKNLLTFLIFIFSFLVLSFGEGLIFVPSSFASTLYLSPQSANIPAGGTISVQVRLNTQGESINGVSAYLSYPSDKLDVASIGYGGSFSIAAEGAYGGGGIRISRGSISGVVGDVNIATVSFRGKSQGVATVSFIGGSAAPKTSDSSDSLNLGGSGGGSYTVGPGQKSVTSTTPPKGPVSTLKADTEKPIITNITVSSISTNSATITWQTNEKADSTVEYGLGDKYFLDRTDNNLVTDHAITLEGQVLTPGTMLHFRVKSKDETNNEGISGDRSFNLKGYSVKIKVTDVKKNPIKNTRVLLYTEPLSSITDLNGEVVFTDVTPGKHLVVVKLKNNLDRTQDILVQDDVLLQNFSLVVERPSSVDYIAVLLLILFIVVGLFILFLYWKRRQTI